MRYPEQIFTAASYRRFKVAFRYREVGSYTKIAKEEGVGVSAIRAMIVKAERAIRHWEIQSIAEVRCAGLPDGPTTVLNCLGSMDRDEVAKSLATLTPDFIENIGVGPIGLKEVYNWAGVTCPRWLTDRKTPEQAEIGLR
ncbi:hypothetical protein [Pseudomonas serbica]|uniref:hypothetical protein n=1 Tax=Pseudomonas serbica TaxID=2965074 RepID=UPI00237A0934|nr:hypothetical protein [Pseudomonas serbica]